MPTTIIEDGTLAAPNTLSAASHTIVMRGGTLALQGSSQTLNNGLENGGTIQLGVPGVTPSGTVLTVNSYMGNNGTIAMNAFLGMDGSASEKLVISNGGMADGNTVLRITNLGGPGPLTNANGIQVVEALGNATTTTGAFTLGNPDCGRALSTIVCSWAASTATIPRVGSCARRSLRQRDRGRKCPLAPIRQ